MNYAAGRVINGIKPGDWSTNIPPPPPSGSVVDLNPAAFILGYLSAQAHMEKVVHLLK
jgi:hypothetical protein